MPPPHGRHEEGIKKEAGRGRTKTRIGGGGAGEKSDPRLAGEREFTVGGRGRVFGGSMGLGSTRKWTARAQGGAKRDFSKFGWGKGFGIF
jgi:hypothetical protein